MKPVLVIGGGISGLSTAYWLTKLDVPCEVVEKSNRLGGLLSSEKTSFGLVESAANGFLAQDDIVDLCEDLGVELAERKGFRKRKFIFRKKPRRWPLSFKETLPFIKGLLKFIFRRKAFLEIKPRQTLSEWAEERFGKAALEWLIAPALQGVYAGNPQRLSARMVLGAFAGKSLRRKTGLRGTLAPKNGMGELVQALEDWLTGKGVLLSKSSSTFSYDKDKYGGVVVATSAFDLRSLADGPLKDSLPQLEVESLPLVSATLFFKPASSDLKGFGCLFPRREGFYSLGVLFNECIFEGRSEVRSETWILGGAFQKNAARLSDDEILRQIKEDRKRLYRLEDHAPILYSKITRWEQALPHVNIDLEEQIQKLDLPKGIYLSGNYLGRIGLSQIVSRNKELALKIKEDLSV